MSDTNDMDLIPPGTSRFATTHWSVVLAAGSPESTRYQEAIEILCKTYWFPLYAYLRRCGYDTHQAEDHTQGFFTSLFEKQGLRWACAKRGKFRSYLLGAMKHFLSDEKDRAQAKKRGGGAKVLSLNFEDGESQYALEPVNQLSPEKLFERLWAVTVLKRSMQRLEAELATMHEEYVSKCLVAYLAPTEDLLSYRDMAVRLNMTEGAVKAAVYRMRKRYRQLLRDEIAQTVVTKEQVEEELQDLFAAFSS
jgi:DNA-directed RNA polymerase specialized sigma24 family protein